MTSYALSRDLPELGTAARTWPPPDELKRDHLAWLFETRGHSVLVESGTYLGGTVDYFHDRAARIVSIEIEPGLHAAAEARFASSAHVEILLGDAARHVPRVVAALDEPPLVFLDGHFSHGITGRGDEVEPAATILDDLAALPLKAGTTIVVDDLRLFGCDPDFPSLDSLLEAARRAVPAARIYGAVDALVVLA